MSTLDSPLPNAAIASLIADRAGGDSKRNTARAAGLIIALLRLEGLGVFAVAIVVYWQQGYSWPLFAALILAPDLVMLAYLAGPRAGALFYNLAHTYVVPLALVAIGYLGVAPLAIAAGLIWIAHIGMDRALGFGLKFPGSFSDSHLGHVGRR